MIQDLREDIIETKKQKFQLLEQSFGVVYPEKNGRTHTNKEALDQFDSFVKEEKVVTLVGRVRSFRVMGKNLSSL